MQPQKLDMKNDFRYPLVLMQRTKMFNPENRKQLKAFGPWMPCFVAGSAALSFFVMGNIKLTLTEGAICLALFPLVQIPMAIRIPLFIGSLVSIMF